MDQGPEIYGDSKGLPVGKPGTAKPSASEVADFHTNSDVDVRPEALHHTLGSSGNQASPGDHTHDGGSSPLLLSGYSVQTSAAIATWRLQVEAALKRLGVSITP